MLCHLHFGFESLVVEINLFFARDHKSNKNVPLASLRTDFKSYQITQLDHLSGLSSASWLLYECPRILLCTEGLSHECNGFLVI